MFCNAPVTMSLCGESLLWRSPSRFPLLKNGLRIFSLGVLATKVDPSFLTGRFHRQGGIIFLLIALVAIFLLIWILRRGESEPRNSPVKSTK